MTNGNVIGRLWDRVRRSAAVTAPAFRIPASRVVDDTTASRFVSRQSYFEIRINEQFIRDRRDYWNNYNPLVVTLCDFIYDTTRTTVPFVVGPDLLSSIEQLDDGGRVRYLNTRVVGPTPYSGDDLAVFVGLFRTRTSPWAQHALGLIESVTRVFDPTKLSSGYLEIAGSILNGVEGMLGIGNDVDFRVGQRDVYTAPGLSGGNPLHPGYFAMIHVNERDVDVRRFWVRDNRLWVGDRADRLTPYVEHDFILWQLRSLDTRDDFETFDFHREWLKVQDRIWSGEPAEDHIRAVLHLLAVNRDIIRPHRNRLKLYYRRLYQEELGAYDRDLSAEPHLFARGTTEEELAASLGRLSRFRVNESVLGAMCRTHGRVLSVSRGPMPRPVRGPRPITNADLVGAVVGEEFADEALDEIDPAELATALSLELSH